MPNTFKNIVKQAVFALRGAGLEGADVDVRILLAHAENCTHVDLIIRANDDVSPPILALFNSYIARRIAHEPVAYITNKKEFWSLDFMVNDHVLIPRPETEGLVGRALEMIAGVKTPNIIDIGTGSGAVLISLLTERENATGTGVDISGEALAVAKQNAKNNGVDDRCLLLQSDYLQNIDGKFDLLVSNPPYISDAAMDGLAENVKAYEPTLALRGGEDGLHAYRQIIGQAGSVLNPKGAIVFEIGYDQGVAVCAMLKSADYSEITILKDLAGHDRVISAKI